MPTLYFSRIILFVCLLQSGLGLTADRPLKVHFINVGYADAIFVELPDGSNLLIDAGSKQEAAKVFAYLTSLGVKRVDRALITHPHENHFGGFQSLLEDIEIGGVYINGDMQGEDGYEELFKKFALLNLKVETLRAEDSLFYHSGKVSIRILNPRTLSEDMHDNALVTWLEYEARAFLFTADINPKKQEELLTLYPFIKKADCVQIPHHGRSLSDKFYEVFNGKILIISTGGNPWGGIDQRFDAHKGKGKKNNVWRTDKNNSIIVVSDGKTIAVKPQQP